MRSKLIYLASPYSSPHEEIRRRRFDEVTKIAARILLECPDVAVFGPITQSHPIAAYLPDDTNNSGFWLPVDFAILLRCDELWVSEMEGVEHSTGVALEIKAAVGAGIPIHFVETAIEANRV